MADLQDLRHNHWGRQPEFADATRESLLAQARPPLEYFDPATLDGLPSPAQRLLSSALPAGTPLSRLIELSMEGEIKLGGRWLPFTAHQILRAGSGFAWAPTVGGRVLRFSGADTLGPDGARIEFRLHGRIPIVRGTGDDIRHSAQGRLAAETVAWLPQALTPQAGARWQAVDDHRAIVTVDAAGTDVDVEINVDDEGHLVWLGLQRWNDSAKPPGYASFGGSVDGIFAAPNGVSIAGGGTVGWDWRTAQEADGAFFRYRITSAFQPESGPSPRYTRRRKTATSGVAADVSAPSPTVPAATVELYWIPLGAGAAVVQASGRIFEAISARRHHRPRGDLYHAALQLHCPEGRFTIEQTPVPDGNGTDRGVVAVGPVGIRAAGRLRIFRYEVRCWCDGIIPDLVDAVDSPIPLSNDADLASRIVDVLPSIPTPVWGRDEARTGEMWNSNSVIAWVLTRSGIDARALLPPPGGRAPGWFAGCVVADRNRSRVERSIDPAGTFASGNRYGAGDTIEVPPSTPDDECVPATARPTS